MYNNIYQNKKVFITGHTGFKGSWLTIWLRLLGAKIYGYSLNPNTSPSMFEELSIGNRIEKSVMGDILDEPHLNSVISEFNPDIVFHLAAQPLVLLSYEEPLLTYKTNVIGTLNVLEAARKTNSVKAFVNITTDKCYENNNTEHAYIEEDPMGGYDMYSSSKGCVEILSSSYRRSFLQSGSGYALATARAGNVIGGGDWAKDRLIPDCIRAIIGNTAVEIRNPKSTRPWQFVLEPLHGYLTLGQKLLEFGKDYAQSFNFGPDYNDTRTVEQIANNVVNIMGKGRVNAVENTSNHEALLLTLNSGKALKYLNWCPTYNVEKAIAETVNWYKHFYNKDLDMYNFTVSQIKNFEDSIK